MLAIHQVHVSTYILLHHHYLIFAAPVPETFSG